MRIRMWIRMRQRDIRFCHIFPLMRSYIVLSLALLLCLPAAGQSSSTDELVALSLKSLVAESSAELESYRFLMDMEQNIDLMSQSSEEPQSLVTRSFGFGAANMSEKALKLSLVALTYDRSDASNTSIMALEEYLVNDTIYMKLDGNWTYLKMPSLDQAWSSQTTMDQQLLILNQSRLTLLDSENVDDINCYKVLAEMDLESMADQLSAEAASLLPDLGINYSEIYSNSSLTATYWIDKESHNLKKADVLQVFVINPQSALGLSAEEAYLAVEMTIRSKVSRTVQGYNEELEIRLPAEALGAADILADLMAGGEASTVALAGNESELEENMSATGPVQIQDDSLALGEILNQSESLTCNLPYNQTSLEEGILV